MSTSLLYAASTVGADTLTSDRVVATVASLVALGGTVAGVLSLRRSTGRTRGSLVALAAGLAGLLAGVLVLATADGGPGTGNGVVGGYVAVVLGPIAAILGGLALARRRSHV
jgi:hypothetical protein